MQTYKLLLVENFTQYMLKIVVNTEECLNFACNILIYEIILQKYEKSRYPSHDDCCYRNSCVIVHVQLRMCCLW